MNDLLTDAEVMRPRSSKDKEVKLKGGKLTLKDLVLMSDDDVSSVGKEVPDAARPLVGANRMIATMAGVPVDLVSWGINKLSGAVGGPPDLIKDAIGSSGSFKKAMGALPFGGANPDDVRPANTPGERILEASGEAGASMLVPGLAAEALLAKAVTVDGAIMGALQMLRGTGPKSNTAIGVAGGALGEVAAESVPADARLSLGPLDFSPKAVKDAARLGGNLVGGMSTMVAQSALEAGGRAARSAWQAATEPVKLRAARTMLGRAEDPGAFRAAAENAAEAPLLVEGSRPTTFQATGDLGIGGLEREVAASQTGVPRFAGVREEQNSARLAELEKLQKSLPEDADAGAFVTAVQKWVQQIAETFGERVNVARTKLDEAFKVGRLNEAEYGVALREAPVRLRTALEKIEDDLWRAIDPDKTVPFNPTDLKAGFAKIEKDIPRTSKMPEAEEASLLDVVLGPKNSETGIRIGGLDDKTTFGEITALRSRLTDATRDRTLTPTVKRRISIMLEEVDLALKNTGLAVPGLSNAEAVIGSVLERYAAARAATRDIKERFGEGAVGRVLAEGDNEGFRMTASNVAKNLFDRPEDLRAYLASVGDDAAARASLQDYAAFSLQKDAVKDGMMSTSKYRKWLDDHDYVLKEFPDLRAKFGDMRAAQSTLDDVLAAQKQALTDYQDGAIKRLFNTKDPELVITNALKRPGEFEALVAEASKNPAAIAGMKRAVVNFMMKQARSTAESGTSGETQINAATLQKFFLNNKRSLSALFSPEQLASMESVTKDLQQANRSIAAVRIPGGSNTAQDTSGRFMTALSQVVSQHGGKAAGGVGGSMFGPVGAAAGVAAGAVADAMRVARVNSIENALVEMMLDPKMAAEWLRKVPATEAAETAASSFARRLKALTAAQVTEAMNEFSDDAGKPGGLEITIDRPNRPPSEVGP